MVQLFAELCKKQKQWNALAKITVKKKEKISLDSLSYLLLVMPSKKRDQHDNRHGTGAGNPLLSKKMPKPAVFPWQMSMKAQPQGTITKVAEIQPSRGKESEPARLAGWLHWFAVQMDNCQSRQERCWALAGWTWEWRRGQGRQEAMVVDSRRTMLVKTSKL